MTVLILLAAGRGSRLRDKTEGKPKCLNEYKGIPLLEHILTTASQTSTRFNKTILVSGYRADLLSEYCDRRVLNLDWESSGPFKSMEYASEFLKRYECITTYTDVIYDIGYLEACFASEAPIFIPSNNNFLRSWESRKVSVIQDLESFRINGNSVTEIGIKPRKISEVQGQFAGIIKTNPFGWKQLSGVAKEINMATLDITTLLNQCIKRGIKVETSQVNGNWKEFDIPEDFE